jgi:hypothetical protein
MSRMNSSVVIARLLDSEGFSEFAQNATERYWMRSICDPRRRRKYRKLDKELSAIAEKLTDAEKLILGKFISLHKRMAFDTGLRIGLTAFARKHDKEYQLLDLAEQSASGGTEEPDSQKV